MEQRIARLEDTTARLTELSGEMLTELDIAERKLNKLIKLRKINELTLAVSINATVVANIVLWQFVISWWMMLPINLVALYAIIKFLENSGDE